MQEAGISTLHDFNEFVGKQQESLTQLDGVGKAIRKKQTALKHLDTFQRLKPISDKSKRGMGFVRKQYAEKHQQELNRRFPYEYEVLYLPHLRKYHRKDQ